MGHEKLSGDETLFETEVTEMSREEYRSLDFRAALAWDHFALPDGSRNPTLGGTDGHALMSPREGNINEALNRILSRILADDEQWLLTIPRRVGRLRSLEAAALVSDDGRAAIVIPHAAFGAFFSVNEVFLDCRTMAKQEESKNGESALGGMPPIGQEDLPGLFANWLLGVESEEHASEVSLESLSEAEWNIASRIDLFHELSRWHLSRDARRWIWQTTVIQQVFIVLHEFGHLICAGEERRQNIGEDVYRLCFNGLEDECQADSWAARHIQRGIPALWENQNREIQYIALYLLFGAMELLRGSGYLYDEVKKTILVTRWCELLKLIDPQVWSGVQEADARTQLDDFSRYFLSAE